MAWNRLVRAAVAAPLAALCGCATLISGPRQRVEVRPAPAGAAVFVKFTTGLEAGRGVGRTSVYLDRIRDYQVEVVAPGYEPATITLTKATNKLTWLNVVNLFGFFYDRATGAAYKFQPSVVDVSLKPAGTGRGDLEGSVSLLDDQGRTVRVIPLTLKPAK